MFAWTSAGRDEALEESGCIKLVARRWSILVDFIYCLEQANLWIVYTVVTHISGQLRLGGNGGAIGQPCLLDDEQYLCRTIWAVVPR